MSSGEAVYFVAGIIISATVFAAVRSMQKEIVSIQRHLNKRDRTIVRIIDKQIEKLDKIKF